MGNFFPFFSLSPGFSDDFSEDGSLRSSSHSEQSAWFHVLLLALLPKLHSPCASLLSPGFHFPTDVCTQLLALGLIFGSKNWGSPSHSPFFSHHCPVVCSWNFQAWSYPRVFALAASSPPRSLLEWLFHVTQTSAQTAPPQKSFPWWGNLHNHPATLCWVLQLNCFHTIYNSMKYFSLLQFACFVYYFCLLTASSQLPV